jgi:hypothetical protein
MKIIVYYLYKYMKANETHQTMFEKGERRGIMRTYRRG